MTDENEDRYDAILDSEHPEAVIGVVLHLSGMRAAYLVGKGLAAKFPTDSLWEAAISSPQFLEMVEEFAQVISDIRTASQFGPVLTPETVQQAVSQHYGRALEAVREFAQALNVPGEDVLAALIDA